MFPIGKSDSDFQVACVGDWCAVISATDIVYVALCQEVFKNELETDLQMNILLQIDINALSPSLSPFFPLGC
jgi:hypothetical protein